MDSTLVTVATPDLRGFEPVIHRVAEIADTLAYRAVGDDPGPSFLLSGYGLETYRQLAEAGQVHVVLKDGEPVAFAVVYPPGIAASRGDPGTRYIRERYGDVPVIKQIATARGHERHGYSTLLYRDFAERHPDLPLFAAIAEEPRNYGSERFHAKLGFTPCARFTAHPDGRPRGIWRRPPIARYAP